MGLWVADITYIRIAIGFCYLAVILDVCSRKVVGYAVSARIDTPRTLAALQSAIQSRRLTFASYFMQGGGNILTLQRVLGHKDVEMTMRYAHLAPQHLQEVKALHPLTALRIG